MMKNQYLKETKKKIAQYDSMKDKIELRKQDIEYYMMKREMAESEQDKLEIDSRIKKIKLELLDLEKEVYAMEKGFRRLPPIAYRIIELKYRKKETWVNITFEIGYGLTRCKEIGKEAIILISEYLYGLTVHQDLPLIAGRTYY